MTNNQNQQVSFALIEITTENLSITPENFDENTPVQINIGLNFGINSEKQSLKTLFKASFHQNDQEFLIIETGCAFALDQNSWKMLANDEIKKFILPRTLAAHFALLTAGTARGILHAKTENSPLNRFIIPANNLDGLIEKDIVLNY
ncbi:MAG: hypothetical protein HGA72_04805 [Chlorobiaceae bacterium]|nr:hypothetical protein [Chlorobiaceae bacterium]